MPISHERLAALRPFLFHLTARANLERILRTRRIESAASLLRKAGNFSLARTRRREHVSIQVDGETITLRDQAPLHEGNLALDKGWTFADFISHLNERVFFWPGTEAGPIAYGTRHFERYTDEKPVILRLPTAEILAANPRRPPLLCRYNSGSPRCSGGRKSPRSSRTFLPCAEVDFGVGQVVEVTFVGDLSVPDSIQVGAHPQGPWRVR